MWCEATLSPCCPAVCSCHTWMITYIGWKISLFSFVKRGEENILNTVRSPPSIHVRRRDVRHKIPWLTTPLLTHRDSKIFQHFAEKLYSAMSAALIISITWLSQKTNLLQSVLTFPMLCFAQRIICHSFTQIPAV